jgi:hypothetical protein
MATTFNVTTASQVVLPYRERQGWAIQNISDATINITFDNSGVVTTSAGASPGFTLAPNEKIISTSGSRDYTSPWNAVAAIHGSAGNKVLSVQEW